MRHAARRSRPLRLAAVAAAALVAGMLTDSDHSMAQEEQQARLTARYQCDSGAGEAEVGVSAAFPASGTAGRPIRPGGAAVEITLPVAALLPADTAAVSSSASLTTLVEQGDQEAEAEWSDLAAPSAQLPDSGALTLTHTGRIPPVTVGAEGDVAFSVRQLALTLTPQPGAEATAAPEPVELACSPAEGQDTLLATVPVTDEGDPGGESTPPVSGGPEDADGSGPADDPSIKVDDPATAAAIGPCPDDPPRGELDPGRLPEPPPGASISDNEPASACAVPVGFSDVEKLDGAMIVNDPRKKPGTMRLALMQRSVSAEGYNELDSVGIIGFPDATSTFLSFGFQPTSARIEFEAQPATVVNVNDGGTMTTTTGYYQHLRLYDVRINGVPLKVGPDCRTSRRIDTRLSGEYDFLAGGILEGSIDIPPFSGCGTGGEDLDGLFTAAISGPGNRLKIRQGAVYYPGGAAGTVPELPSLD